mgnify:CR=1 FL=1|tara:strand:+ start:932 stop:1126 length:195 start_codon:yes stop_codon:yes gene_type:complete
MTHLSLSSNTQIKDFKEFIKTLKKPKNIKHWYSISSDMAGNIIQLTTEDSKIINYVKAQNKELK